MLFQYFTEVYKNCTFLEIYAYFVFTFGTGAGTGNLGELGAGASQF